MTVIVELSIVPIGEGVSLSGLLAHAVKELQRHGVVYEVTPMCTVFEAESLKEAFKIAEAAHESLFKAGAKRVLTTVKVDDRRDVERHMEDKVRSLREALKKV